MIVQWCIKGLALPDDEDARQIITRRAGLMCNWWRDVSVISPQEIREKLHASNLDMHVNHFKLPDPNTGREFSELTPFISLSAGTVERETARKTNIMHRARSTALWFGTDFGRRPEAYLYTCWVLLGPRPAVEIEGVAEEVRDLNTYRRYSPYQTEGEVVAKVAIPDNQIQMCEKWTLKPLDRRFERSWVYQNPRFTHPDQLSNVRNTI